MAKFLLSLIVLGVSTFTGTTEAFKNSYRCTSVIETTLEAQEKKIT